MNKRVISVCGDAQAEALALVLQSLPALRDEFEIVYAAACVRQRVPGRLACAFSYEQYGAASPNSSKPPKSCRKIVFPPMRLNLLWPMGAPNPYNLPEPPDFPLGRYPFGDQFIMSCIKRGVPADDIMRHYRAPQWSGSWPNLDRLFQDESAALSALDAKCDVKIGSFVLKHFRKKRLFWAANAPTNALLAELVFRTLHASFGPGMETDRAAIGGALANFGGRDVLGGAAAPVHPLVAQHFRLEWYNPSERYACFGGSPRTFDEYFREMIEHATARHAASAASESLGEK